MRFNGFWNAAWLETVVFGSSCAFGTDYTFNNSSGDWNDPSNWSPPTRIPTASDTATILNGHTCKVQAQDQNVRSMTNYAGGLLEVIDRTLTVGSSSRSTSISIGGIIDLKDEDFISGTVPTVKIHNNTTFTGSGGLRG